jgi:pimeloyl-ACP methyl ester carboxylesterase
MQRARHVRLCASVATALLLLYSTSLFGQGKADISGSWLGSLDLGQMKLRLVFRVSKESDGTFRSLLDSPDQGAKDIPVAATTVEGDLVHMNVTAVAGMFEGMLSSDGSEISGTWKQGGMEMPLTVKRSESAPEVRRPQHPVKPYPYDDEEVTFENSSAGVQLTGTLTLPRTRGPHPAVMLITGSGPQDRDETIFGHKPFLVIADYLTRRGFAVLRCDDRGVGGSTGDISQSTTIDFAGDVLAGIGYLKARKEIDARRIGLIGHSEGGIVAPVAAAQSRDVRFLVLLAGTSLRGAEILRLQQELIARATGKSDEEVARYLEDMKQLHAIIDSEEDSTRLSGKVRAHIRQMYDESSEEDKKRTGDPDRLIEGQVKAITSPWFRFFFAYDPKEALRGVTVPVLALNGEKDLQVPPRENLFGIESALREGGNTAVTVIEIPGLNHLFQTAETGSPLEYASIEETFSPDALKIMGDWIEQQVK